MTTANGQTPAPFMQDAPAVISTLGTDAHQGLTSEQAAHNLNQYGPNAFTKPKPESMLSRIVTPTFSNAWASSSPSPCP